jgi:hypothetical protein
MPHPRRIRRFVRAAILCHPQLRDFIWAQAAFGTGSKRVLRFGIVCGILALMALAAPVHAQQPSLEELMLQIKVLQRRVDEFGGRQQKPKSPTAARHRATPAPAAATATPAEKWAQEAAPAQ